MIEDKKTPDEPLGQRLGRIPSEVRKLVEKRFELLILDVGDMVTGMITKMIYKIIGAVLMLIGFIFLLHALSLFAGDLLGDTVLGYVVVAGFLLIVGLILFYLNPRSMVKGTKESMMKSLEKNIADKISSTDKDGSAGSKAGEKESTQNPENR